MKRVEFFGTQIREFFTGYLIFDIFTCALYEISVSSAYKQNLKTAPFISFILSLLVVFLYIFEIMVMVYIASKQEVKTVTKKLKVIFFSLSF